MEAVQLREFGWTQQQIVDDLGVPRQTISFWLGNVGKGIGQDIGKQSVNANNDRDKNG